MSDLEVIGVSKSYGPVRALEDISLSLDAGVIGLVGPNGAGKTTLMRIIASLIAPTRGTLRWHGRDVSRDGPAIRAVLGYLPQDFGVYPDFTARQFLRYLAAMKRLPGDYGKRRVDEMLELVNLERDADRRLRTYSGGMKQRVGIAQALLSDPELLIVDEPTAGLDPTERVRFRTLIASLTGDRTVLLSTHIIADIEAVTAHLVLLKAGHLLADTMTHSLINAARGRVWEVQTDAEAARRLQATHPISSLITGSNGVVVRVVGDKEPLAGSRPVEPTLEDAYLLAMR
jgi:ABC-2 type transport system ATP-binding protein